MSGPVDPQSWCWPRPWRWSPDGGRTRLPEGGLIAPDATGADGVARVHLDEVLGPAACRLVIAESGITALAGDGAGSRRLLALWRQLRRHDGAVQTGVLEDRPALLRRGVMLDISRDRVPRQDELLDLVPRLAALGCNHLQLYTEHTFAYPGHAAVWRDADPMTPAQLRELDAACGAQGIELAANQNCFGHWERWFRHAPYDELAELPPAELAQRLADPECMALSLAPTDARVLPLIGELLDVQLPCVASGVINIGCDETADVGTGRSRAAVERAGYAAVYGGFVRQVAEHVVARGGRPQFWADMAFTEPAIWDELPAGLTALAWGYEADSDFAAWGAALQTRGRRWWACPGTAAWRSFVGRQEARRGSVAAAVAAALRYDATGLLVTDWGDNGHRQQWPITWLGLVEGLGAAWSGRPVTAADLPAIGRHGFGDVAAARFTDALSAVELGLTEGVGHPRRFEAPLANAGLLFGDSLQAAADDRWAPEPARWHELARRLAALQAGLAEVGPAWVDELTHSWAVARWCADRSLARRGEPQRWARVRAAQPGIVAEHRRLWLRRSRPGGLADSCAWYERMLAGAPA